MAKKCPHCCCPNAEVFQPRYNYLLIHLGLTQGTILKRKFASYNILKPLSHWKVVFFAKVTFAKQNTKVFFESRLRYTGHTQSARKQRHSHVTLDSRKRLSKKKTFKCERSLSFLFVEYKWLNRPSVFTARRLAKRGICRRRVSVCLSVCVCVRHTPDPVLYQNG